MMCSCSIDDCVTGFGECVETDFFGIYDHAPVTHTAVWMCRDITLVMINGIIKVRLGLGLES